MKTNNLLIRKLIKESIRKNILLKEEEYDFLSDERFERKEGESEADANIRRAQEIAKDKYKEEERSSSAVSKKRDQRRKEIADAPSEIDYQIFRTDLGHQENLDRLVIKAMKSSQVQNVLRLGISSDRKKSKIKNLIVNQIRPIEINTENKRFNVFLGGVVKYVGPTFQKRDGTEKQYTVNDVLKSFAKYSLKTRSSGLDTEIKTLPNYERLEQEIKMSAMDYMDSIEKIIIDLNRANPDAEVKFTDQLTSPNDILGMIKYIGESFRNQGDKNAIGAYFSLVGLIDSIMQNHQDIEKDANTFDEDIFDQHWPVVQQLQQLALKLSDEINKNIEMFPKGPGLDRFKRIQAATGGGKYPATNQDDNPFMSGYAPSEFVNVDIEAIERNNSTVDEELSARAKPQKPEEEERDVINPELSDEDLPQEMNPISTGGNTSYLGEEEPDSEEELGTQEKPQKPSQKKGIDAADMSDQDAARKSKKEYNKKQYWMGTKQTPFLKSYKQKYLYGEPPNVEGIPYKLYGGGPGHNNYFNEERFEEKFLPFLIARSAKNRVSGEKSQIRKLISAYNGQIPAHLVFFPHELKISIGNKFLKLLNDKASINSDKNRLRSFNLKSKLPSEVINPIKKVNDINGFSQGSIARVNMPVLGPILLKPRPGGDTFKTYEEIHKSGEYSKIGGYYQKTLKKNVDLSKGEALVVVEPFDGVGAVLKKSLVFGKIEVHPFKFQLPPSSGVIKGIDIR